MKFLGACQEELRLTFFTQISGGILDGGDSALAIGF